VYCHSSCEGESGWAVAHDHSATKSSNFTGWGDYSGSAAVSILGSALDATAEPLSLEANGPPDPVGASTPRLMVSTVDSAETSALGVMRRPQDSSDAVPTNQMISFSANSGANPSLARHVLPTGTDGSIAGEAWLVPGSGKICLIDTSATSSAQGGAGCVVDGVADTGRLMIESTSAISPGKALVSGLVPDGVTTVSLKTSSGRTLQVPVTENVYMDEVAGWVSKASFDGSSGPVSVTMEEP
jgi:hypothetical protein